MTSSKPSHHAAIVFSSGMGHLKPVTRLAVTLSSLGCSVTVVVPRPLVSDAESRHLSLLLSSHVPHLHLLDLHLLPFTDACITDPFFLQWQSISNSAHLLPHLLSSLPALSALIVDIPVCSAFSSIATAIGVPVYALATTSAAMVALMVTLSCTDQVKLRGGDVRHLVVPGLPAPIPPTSVPPFFLHSSPLATNPFLATGRSLSSYSGILINTLSDLEADCLSALSAGEVVDGLPEVVPVGPLQPYDRLDSSHHQLTPWLDSQPDGSVIYVSVGSRTVLPPSQMEELKRGLEMSGVSYLWVVKTKIVDKEEDINGDHQAEKVEEVSEKGLVVRGWVEQREVLKHRAVGGFVSHCGWNSVTEAVWEGVPVLAWPQGGDQMINATVVQHSKIGRWEKGWQGGEGGGGGGGVVVVKGEEIGEQVREFMKNEEVKEGARRMKEAARRAAGDGGSSRLGLVQLVEKWKQTKIEKAG